MVTFKCFLRWKGKKYRINMEAMNHDHTILKPYFVAKKKSPDNMTCSTENSVSCSKPVGLKRNSVGHPKMLQAEGASISTQRCKRHWKNSCSCKKWWRIHILSSTKVSGSFQVIHMN